VDFVIVRYRLNRYIDFPALLPVELICRELNAAVVEVAGAYLESPAARRDMITADRDSDGETGGALEGV
jgi:hypothetical protein